mgnify:CR=1 FL=1
MENYETYTERRKALEQKYAKQIALLAEVNKVDLSVAWDMFKCHVAGATQYGFYNADEARADIEGLQARIEE